MMNRQRADDSLQRARAAHQMAGNWLGGTHREAAPMFAEKALNRLGFSDIVGGRRRAVRVDVVDFLPLESPPCRSAFSIAR